MGRPRGSLSVASQKFVEQIVAGTRKGAGPVVEAKAGISRWSRDMPVNC